MSATRLHHSFYFFVDETQVDKWQVIVIMSCVGLVLLLAVITLLCVAFLIIDSQPINIVIETTIIIVHRYITSVHVL